MSNSRSWQGKRWLVCLGLVSLGLIALLVANCAPLLDGSGALLPENPAQVAACSQSDGDGHGCTVVTAARGNRVFFGGNDDYHNRDSTYWVDPGNARRYGGIYFGTRDNVQQGFNEMGLAYDANGLPKAPVTDHPGDEAFWEGYTAYPIRILGECATVEEVVAWVQAHRWHEVMHDQMHFADATGDAVIISAGPDGRVAFTRKPPGDGHLVSTNFNVANRANGSYPCWRYSRANTMLDKIGGGDELDAERLAAVMEAVHVESAAGWTLYTVVADLPQRLVYVYYMFQYDTPIVLSIDDEISREPRPSRLSALFPAETQARATAAYEALQARPARCGTVGWAWLAAVGLSVVALLVLARPWRRSLLAWLPVAIVLGPLGLVAWWLVRRGEGTEGAPRLWPRILGETAAELPPYVAGMVLAMLVAALVPAVGGNTTWQLVLFYGVPVTWGLLLHQGLLAFVSRRPYLGTVARRLPAVLVTAHLALAGIWAVSLSLSRWSIEQCGLGPQLFVSWWVLAVVGALPGGLLLYGYQAWAVRRGYGAWAAESPPGDTAAHAPWRRLWPWLVGSVVALVGGLALVVVVSA